MCKNNYRKLSEEERQIVESIRMSNEQLKLIKEYFPIDKKEENPMKTIDVVEDKLSDKKFLKTVVSFYTYLLFHHFSSRNSSIQGLSKVWKPLNISQTVHFGKKCFRQKLFGFEGAIRRYHWFDLEESFEGHFNFFKWNTLYIFANSCILSR